MNTLTFKKIIPREKDSVMCPSCKGYAEKVEPTKVEINSKYNCGRNYGCCVRVFVCKVCGRRIIAKAESPEWID